MNMKKEEVKEVRQYIERVTRTKNVTVIRYETEENPIEISIIDLPPIEYKDKETRDKIYKDICEYIVYGLGLEGDPVIHYQDIKLRIEKEMQMRQDKLIHGSEYSGPNVLKIIGTPSLIGDIDIIEVVGFPYIGDTAVRYQIAKKIYKEYTDEYYLKDYVKLQ